MTDRGASIGLVLRHSHDHDPVASAVVSAVVRAIAGPLVAAGLRFLTRSVDDEEAELRTYRLWARVGGVAGVILLGAAESDARIRLLRQIDMPFAALAPADLDVDYPAVTLETAAAARALTAYLRDRGATRQVYVTAQRPPEPLVPDSRVEVVQTSDVVAEAVRIGTAGSVGEPITLILDSDRDTVAVLEELQASGVAVPDAVSLVCWSDSQVCRSASPPITAIDRHGREIGELLGTAAIAAIHEDRAVVAAAPEPVVVERETT